VTEPDVPAFQGPVRCPRCGVGLADDQDWCLSCGTAARTVIAATPSWRRPVALLAVVVVLSGAVLAWAFVTLTQNDDAITAATQTTTTTAAPAAAPAGTTPPTGAPAATTPPVTSTPPAGG
jgi:uncharacterized paraquat-inducible protein A